jgi:transposase
MESGQDISYIMPSVNTQTMNEFLIRMSKDLGTKEAVIVMDRAGWHRSKDLNIPPNIEILFLPPYSPELNPVEKFWQYIKSNTIKNKIYETIKKLETAICTFIKNLDPSLTIVTFSLNHCLT